MDKKQKAEFLRAMIAGLVKDIMDSEIAIRGLNSLILTDPKRAGDFRVHLSKQESAQTQLLVKLKSARGLLEEVESGKYDV